MKGYYTRYGFLAYSESAGHLMEFVSETEAIEYDSADEEEE